MSKKKEDSQDLEKNAFNETVLKNISALLKVSESVEFKRNRCIDNVNLILSSKSAQSDFYDTLENLFTSMAAHENTLKTITYYIEQLEKQIKQ